MTKGKSSKKKRGIKNAGISKTRQQEARPKKSRRKDAQGADAASGIASDHDRKITIDIDVHRRIEAARITFEESDNTILRRILGLDGSAGNPRTGQLANGTPAKGARAKSGGVSDGGWSKISRTGLAIFLPNGTKLRAAYGGISFEGMIAKGAWAVGGGTHKSPSAALNAVARTGAGRPVNLNGWRHWEVLPPGAKAWVRLAEL